MGWLRDEFDRSTERRFSQALADAKAEFERLPKHLRSEPDMRNQVIVSEDGMELAIRNERGQQATLRSAREGGFTAEDIDNARSFKLNSRMIDGQVNRARRFSIAGRTIYVHVNTGPPTWWYPRVELRRGKAMVGWLRVLVAVSWAT